MLCFGHAGFGVFYIVKFIQVSSHSWDLESGELTLRIKGNYFVVFLYKSLAHLGFTLLQTLSLPLLRDYPPNHVVIDLCSCSGFVIVSAHLRPFLSTPSAKEGVEEVRGSLPGSSRHWLTRGDWNWVSS